MRTTLVFACGAGARRNSAAAFCERGTGTFMHIPENSFDQGGGLLDLDRLWEYGSWKEQPAEPFELPAYLLGTTKGCRNRERRRSLPG